ncbi:hypothetical protein C8R42DRAFT_729073 [Lentinula raphanica]|nr:hypothetical protein C8R42DRAFT_729073 [Lentinula raphanica]
MREQSSHRFYASKHYLLPADNVETKRLNAQHNIVKNALGGKLSAVTAKFDSGDRVLESAAGSGIWALEYHEENRENGVILDIECIDISSAQFPCTHPPKVHFSLNSVANLPKDWADSFALAHQRFLVLALNDNLWHSAVSELFRVLRPGGWIELVEIEARDFSSWTVGPNSKKLASLINGLYDERTVMGNLSSYLPEILKDAGFIDVECELRHVPIGGEELSDTPHQITDIEGYSSQLWQELWMGMKKPVIEAARGTQTLEEYEALVQDSANEWKTSKKTSERFYASKQYLLPADNAETRRLDAQHKMITSVFGGLSMAPIKLTNGDRVLESAAGSGIWALEFFEKNCTDGITLAIECIDISSAQFPANHPPQVHFSVNSVVNLPNPEWSDTFSYAHQRLLVAAMNDSRWRSAVPELFRVLRPGGWVELIEIEAQDFTSWSVGPNSTKLAGLVNGLYGDKGIVGDLGAYLPVVLKEAGFVGVRCEARRASIGGDADDTPHKVTDTKGYGSDMWRDLWMGIKGPVAAAGFYGMVANMEEYEALVEASAHEWKHSKEAYTTFYAILGRKP